MPRLTTFVILLLVLLGSSTRPSKTSVQAASHPMVGRRRRQPPSTLLATSTTASSATLLVSSATETSADASVKVADTTTTTTSAPATTTDRTSTGSSSSAPSPKSPNAVVQLFKYVKTSIVKTVDGCGDLYRNHGKCKEIRKKQQAHRDVIKNHWLDQGVDVNTAEIKQQLASIQAGITFEEYSFLQKGKEDRGKVLNLLFLLWGAPRFLPYALMFNPDMLPSPFHSNAATSDAGSESALDKLAREQSAALLQTLLDLERRAQTTPALAKLNIFGKKKQDAQKRELQTIIDTAAQLLPETSALPNPKDGAQLVLNVMRPRVYQRAEEFTRGQARLVGVPKCIVSGLAKIIAGSSSGGFLNSLQPHFMTRGRVVGHLNKIADSDDFLVQAKIDLHSIPKRLLQEACRDRGMLGVHHAPVAAVSNKNKGLVETLTEEDVLRQHLQDWLDLAIHEPNERQAADSELQYNGNLARMTLYSYYSCLAARDGASASRLPRLLYSTPAPSSK